MSATILLGGIGDAPVATGARSGSRGTGAAGFAGAVRDAVADREQRDSARAEGPDGATRKAAAGPSGADGHGRAGEAAPADHGEGVANGGAPTGTTPEGGVPDRTASAGLPCAPAANPVPADVQEEPVHEEAAAGVEADARPGEDPATGVLGDAGAPPQLVAAAPAPIPNGGSAEASTPGPSGAAAAIPGAAAWPAEVAQANSARGDALVPAMRTPADPAPSGASRMPQTAGVADATAAGPAAGGAGPASAPVSAAGIAPAAGSSARLSGSVTSDDATAPPPLPADAASVPDGAGTAASPPSRPAPAPALTPPPAPVARPALLPQVNGPVLALARSAQGEHSLTLTVSPESLGPVTVRAHIAAGTIRLELQAPSDAGREALRAILTDLRRDLAVAAPGASVSVSNQQAPSGTDARSDQGGRFAQGDGDGRGADGGHPRDAAPAHPRGFGGSPGAERAPFAAPGSAGLPAPHGIDVYA